MAKARIETITPPPPPPGKVILEMSMKEAETLRTVLGLVGGDSQYSDRKHAQAVFDALGLAGVAWYRSHDGSSSAKGSITF